MRRATMSTIVVFALGLMVWSVPVVHGAQYLTVNGQDVNSITLGLGQSRTVEVVSDANTSYTDYVGFDSGLVLDNFSHVETNPEAGSVASVVEQSEPAFYGYLCVAAGISTPPSPGVHFVFQYDALQLGETDLKLYDSTFTLEIDSVHITVVPAPMGTAFTYQGRLLDANKPADGLYDFQFELYDNPGPFAAQQGNTIDINDLDVIDGYFTVELDFGSGIFDGNAVWLETTVVKSPLGSDPCTLEPRLELTPTPYALYAKTAGGDGDWRISGNDMYAIPFGNVGIGKTDPSTKLDVVGTVNATAFVGDGSGLTGISGDSDWIESGGNVYRGTGNVGIGTASTTQKLDVAGNVTASRYYDRNNPAYYLDPASTSDCNDMRANIFYDRQNTSYYVDPANTGTAAQFAGSVGIGTTSPSRTLDVNGTMRVGGNSFLEGALRVGPGAGLSGSLHINGTGWPNALYVSASSASDWGIYVAQGNSYFTGNVGIGTTTPAGKLDVNGSIYQRGGSLHADYVFEDNYQLESIEEHSEFMWRNKHLAAIPKSSVDGQGHEIVEVGSHRKGIVEELEKAHIYIEQLHKRINELKSHNNQIQSRLTAMEAAVSKLIKSNE